MGWLGDGSLGGHLTGWALGVILYVGKSNSNKKYENKKTKDSQPKKLTTSTSCVLGFGLRLRNIVLGGHYRVAIALYCIFILDFKLVSFISKKLSLYSFLGTNMFLTKYDRKLFLKCTLV